MIAKTFGLIVVFGECTSPTGSNFLRIQTVYLEVE